MKEEQRKKISWSYPPNSPFQHPLSNPVCTQETGQDGLMV